MSSGYTGIAVTMDSPREEANQPDWRYRVVVGAGVILYSLITFRSRGDSITSLFQYHPIFMAAAFSFFLPYSFYAARKVKQCRQLGFRKDLVLQHVVSSMAFTVFALLGFAAIYANKIIAGKSHFTTYHGLIGACSVLLAFLHALFGWAMYLKWAMPVLSAAQVRNVHRLVGTFALPLLGASSVVLGLSSFFATRNIPAVERALLGALQVFSYIVAFTA